MRGGGGLALAIACAHGAAGCALIDAARDEGREPGGGGAHDAGPGQPDASGPRYGAPLVLPVSCASSLVAIDLDFDGRDQLVVDGTCSDTITFIDLDPGHPEPTVAARQLGQGGVDHLAATLDGSPGLDLVSILNNQLAIWTGASSNPDLLTRTLLPVGSNPYDLALGRLDGDALDDLAVANLDSDDVTVFTQMPGTAMPGQPASFASATVPVGDMPSSVVIADLDGDLLGELVVVSAATGDVTVWHQDPIGVFTARPPISTGRGCTAWRAVGADFDRDDQPDVAVATTCYPAAIFLLFGDQDSETWFRAPVLVEDEVNAAFVGLVDLDGDDAIDLAAANFGARLLRARPGQPGQFEPAERLLDDVGMDVTAVAAGDFDGDGDEDVAVAEQDPATVYLFLAE